MVRLKVVKEGSKAYELVLFQFLMVRLKVSAAIDYCKQHDNFNSLWCD